MSSPTLSDLQKTWFAEDTGGSADSTSSIDWINAGSKILGSALGGAMSSPPTTSSADSVFGTNLKFNNSGWNVTFGGGSISSDATDAADFGNVDSTSGPSMNNYLPYALLFVAALIAWKILKK